MKRQPVKIIISILLIIVVAGFSDYLARGDKPCTQNSQSVKVTSYNLPQAQQTEIINAVMDKNTTVPAGTQLNVDNKTLAGSCVSGTFRYGNGLHGTFSAQKKNQQWVVVSYEKV